MTADSNADADPDAYDALADAEVTMRRNDHGLHIADDEDGRLEPGPDAGRGAFESRRGSRILPGSDRRRSGRRLALRAVLATNRFDRSAVRSDGLLSRCPGETATRIAVAPEKRTADRISQPPEWLYRLETHSNHDCPA